MKIRIAEYCGFCYGVKRAVVLEGPVALSDCVLDEDVCENSNMCVTKIVWEKMKKGIEDVID